LANCLTHKQSVVSYISTFNLPTLRDKRLSYSQANRGESYRGLYGGSAAAEGIRDELRGSSVVFSSFFLRSSSKMT